MRYTAACPQPFFILSTFSRNFSIFFAAVLTSLSHMARLTSEAANLSDRTYADIERGTVNMRIETVLKICAALRITPDTLLTEDSPNLSAKRDELLAELDKCTEKQKETALELLAVYLKSVK